MTKEEIDFIKLLDDELEKFNSFFVEKEEEYIIRLKVFFLFFNFSFTILFGFRENL
jgi:uncharacterized membrane protein (DUF485 family)